MGQNFKNTSSISDSAIYLEYCINTTISSNLINNNSGTGITNNGCFNTIITDNTLKDNNIGIFVELSEIQFPFNYNNNISIIGNTIENNQFGLRVENVHWGVIKDNSIKFSNSTGASINNALFLIISKNLISSNGQEDKAHGLLSLYLGDSEISNNTVSNNSGDGIVLNACSFLNVSKNIVDLNDDGISLISQTNDNVFINITDNIIRNNNDTGIKIENSRVILVTGNFLRGNGDCIKEIGDTRGITIENNDCGEVGESNFIIPGFNLYLILSLIGIISLILIKRRYKD